VLITIGITLYNKSGLLDGLEPLNEVSRKCRDIELLVVDDCSTDSSYLEARDVLPLCTRYIRHKENSGVSAARNTIITNATGIYLSFIDADDTIDAKELIRLIEEIRKEVSEKAHDIIISPYKVTNKGKDRDSSKSRKQAIKKYPNSQEVLETIENYLLRPNRDLNLVRCLGKFFNLGILRKHCIKFDTSLKNFEDVDFLAKVLRVGARIWSTEIVFYMHQMAELGTSETCNKSRSLVSHAGYIKSTSSMLVTREVLQKKTQLSSSLTAETLNAQAIGAYTCISIVQGCVRINGIKSLFAYSREVKELICIPAIKKAMKKYSHREAGGSWLLASTIRSGNGISTACYGYMKYNRRYGKREL